MLTSIITVIICVVIWKLFFSAEDNPLSQLPGPKRKPIFGNAFELLNIPPNDFLDRIKGYTERFGERYVFKVLYLWVLHISNPMDIEIVLTHSKNITKNTPYIFLQAWLGSGLLLSTGSHWQKRRKILTPTFHFNILKNFSVVMEEKSRDLVNRLTEKNGEEVDLLPMVSDFTLFNICETAMGTQLDSDKSTDTIEYKEAISKIGILMLSRLTNIWLHNEMIFKLSPLGRKFQKYLNRVRAFADNVIKERRRQKTVSESDLATASDGIGAKKKLAMLDLLLEAETEGEIDFEGIRDEVNTFMFAGHDTTAMAITFCLMLLANHEDVQERIYEECRFFVNHDHAATMSDFAEMKYLDAVIKETLRMYPSVPFVGRRITEDFMMADILVKKGSDVIIHIYDLHHREDLYPDPETFNPDRFLHGEPRHPYAYIPFSAGPRNCIGQRFAMQEMKSVISKLCCSFKLVPRTKGQIPELASDMLLKPKQSIYVKFIPREK